MRSSISDQARLRRTLDAKAKALGFDALRVTRAEIAPETAAWLGDFVAAGRHGTMAWMEETLARRSAPKTLWPEARSAIVVALNYGPESDPLAVTRVMP